MEPEILLWIAKITALGLGIFSIVLHEVAHGFAAFRLGDPTAAMQGRLTLNPIKHIDPFMTIMMPLVTWLASGGAFMFGGAKPVPINPYRFRNMRKGMMITGLAGPATNVAICLTCALLLRLPHLGWPLQRVLAHVGIWNLILVLFNMIPVPPLDGSRLVTYLLPRNLLAPYERLTPYGMFIVMGIVISGIMRPVYMYAVQGFILVAGDSWLNVL